jgi:hypothetical protein
MKRIAALDPPDRSTDGPKLNYIELPTGRQGR